MKKILILSCNPKLDLPTLDLEVKDLKKFLSRLGKFDIENYPAVSSEDFEEFLLEVKPDILHFCGHGLGEEGLLLCAPNGNKAKVFSTEQLSDLFAVVSKVININCVVLNACDSQYQARAIVGHINYAIGMRQEILDKAAYSFAVGFYKGLGHGLSIEQAYELGRYAIKWGFSENSRANRKLGSVPSKAQTSLEEHQKPILLAKSTPSSSSELQPSFLEQIKPKIEQEIERKDYKDHAREVYDNFGQFSAVNAASLTTKERKQRKIFLSKVKEFWIEGFLKPSIQNNAAISLDLKARPDAIADLSQGIEALSVELDDSFEELRGTRIYEEMRQGRTLLILGNPGAGKTIALLQLAQRLVERSEQNLSLPIPVVFNLSSWGKERKKLVDWLIDELREKYLVSKSLSESWITNQQLILLLDGLDEVKEDYRNDCVRALNKFIGDYPQTEVAVCSRVKDYEVLTERLQISSAICIQPLSSKQVYQFLDSVGGSLAGLKTLLKNDAELEQFAQTPLILNFMSVAYQGWSAKELISQLRSTPDRHKHLFDTYIDRRLDRGASSEYSKDKALHWLHWLASRMEQEKRTIFLIEKLQPSWLQNKVEEKKYRFRVFGFSGIIFGIVGAIIGGLFFLRIYSLTNKLLLVKIGSQLFGLAGGGIYGLGGAVIGGTITGLPRSILPLEKLSWSWQRARLRFMGEMFTGIAYGLIFGLIAGLIFGLIIKRIFIPSFGQIDNLIGGLIFGLALGLVFGLIGGLVLGLMSGIESSEIDQRTITNQGIYRTQKNCFIVGFGLWLFVGIIDSLVFESILRLISQLNNDLNFGLMDSLTFGVLSGLIGGLIGGVKYGGAACIQHFTLRWILYQKNRIPWNYAKFLDFASDRRLMKRVGGGYIFFHRMLLEHFANKNPD